MPSIKYASRVSRIKPSPIRELMALTQQPGVISFAGGWPAPESFPIEELKEISIRVVEEYGKQALQYGATDGFGPLREIIATRMTGYGIDGITADNILVTTGSQQGLDFTAKLFIDEGDVILCEAPSYIGALNAFHAYCPQFVNVVMDEDGMNMEALEEALKSNSNVKYIYTIPDFQNPTGITMSLEKRKRMVELAERYGVPIVEDNPYYEVRFEGERLPPIKSFDKNGIVIYLGSYSKTFCPGLRIGWIAADKDILRKYNLIKQGADLASNMFGQIQLYLFLSSYSFDDHIERVRAIYRSRRAAMIGTMDETFPKGIAYTRPQGGLFTWVTLPEGFKSEEVFRLAVEKKVAFVPGDSFYPNGGDTRHMRLNYGTMPEDKIIEGVKRLAEVLRSL